METGIVFNELTKLAIEIRLEELMRDANVYYYKDLMRKLCALAPYPITDVVYNKRNSASGYESLVVSFNHPKYPLEAWVYPNLYFLAEVDFARADGESYGVRNWDEVEDMHDWLLASVDMFNGWTGEPSFAMSEE
jgi:hypothetical protein